MGSKTNKLILFLGIFFSTRLLGLEVINLKAEFQDAMYDREGMVSFDVFEQNWLAIERQYGDIYDFYVYKDNYEGDWEEKRSLLREAFYRQFGQMAPKTLRSFDAIESKLPQIETKLLGLLPNYDSSNWKVVVMPSFLTFDGRAVHLKGRPMVLVGADFVAKEETDLDDLLAHELFHLHHLDQVPSDQLGFNLARLLWTEGLAMLASKKVNQSADEFSVLGVDQANPLRVFCQNEVEVAKAAKALLSRLKSEKLEEVRDWFRMSSKIRPVRRGYCVAFWAVTRLSEEYSISQMLAWHKREFTPRLKRSLKQISK